MADTATSSKSTTSSSTKGSKDSDANTETITVTVRKDFDPGLRDALISQLERGTTNFVVGNLADLQRAGAEVVAAGDGEAGKGSGFAAGVQIQANQGEPDDLKDGAQRTLDAEEAAKNPPAAEDPPENKEPDSVDPTSQSPGPAKK